VLYFVEKASNPAEHQQDRRGKRMAAFDLGRLGNALFAIGGGAWYGALATARTGTEIFARIARHFFLFLVLFGGACMLISGRFGGDYGVPLLFREDGRIVGYGIDSLLASPAFLSQFIATLLAGAVWLFAVSLSRREAIMIDAMPLDREWSFFVIRILPTALIPLAVLVWGKAEGVPELAPGELERAIIGILAGQVVVQLIILLSRPVAALPRFISRVLGYTRSRGGRISSLAEGPDLGILKGDPIAKAAVEDDDGITPSDIRKARLPWYKYWIPRAFVHWGMFILAMIVVVQQRQLLPATAIFSLLAFVLALYVFLNFFRENLRFFIAVMIVVAIGWGAHKYKYEFPGLADYYSDPVLIQPGSVNLAEQSSREEQLRTRFSDIKRAAASAGTIEVHRALGGAGKPPLPKFVVVTTSGGAYTATFWTALVLDRLRELSAPDASLPGFIESIRLMTGASGGMVAAAYHAACPGLQTRAPGATPLVDSILADLAGKSDGACGRGAAADQASANPSTATSRFADSLTPVTQQLVQGDLFHLFTPWRQTKDRGLVLEEQWRTLKDTRFETLREYEREGLSPALIFSPMIVETGQPLLISNLELSGIARSSRTGTSLGPAIDFFDVFPKAYDRFTLATAARMSSTFAYVSPAVDLPTDPPRRVVDAGYFDNYGMNIAVGYLSQKEVRDWLRRNTSGVIIVQINAYPAESLVIDTGRRHECKPYVPAEASGGNGGFGWLSTPFEAVWASRQASMVFRNDQEYKALQEIYAGEHIPLARVKFENNARSSFSWYLPERDFNCMVDEWSSAHIEGALADLTRLWWQRGQAAGP
jgi:hypothetical protein